GDGRRTTTPSPSSCLWAVTIRDTSRWRMGVLRWVAAAPRTRSAGGVEADRVALAVADDREPAVLADVRHRDQYLPPGGAHPLDRGVEGARAVADVEVDEAALGRRVALAVRLERARDAVPRKNGQFRAGELLGLELGAERGLVEPDGAGHVGDRDLEPVDGVRHGVFSFAIRFSDPACQPYVMFILVRRKSRLFAIAEYLRGRRTGTTAAEIADRFGVTLRTVYRDLEALRDAALPLRADRGRGGGYALDRAYTLPPVNFTAREAAVLTAL